jgi:hypothetical protein
VPNGLSRGCRVFCSRSKYPRSYCTSVTISRLSLTAFWNLPNPDFRPRPSIASDPKPPQRGVCSRDRASDQHRPLLRAATISAKTPNTARDTGHLARIPDPTAPPGLVHAGRGRLRFIRRTTPAPQPAARPLADRFRSGASTTTRMIGSLIQRCHGYT